MATHSSILAWRIPWTEEPAGPQSILSQSQTQVSDRARIHAEGCIWPGCCGNTVLQVSIQSWGGECVCEGRLSKNKMNVESSWKAGVPQTRWWEEEQVRGRHSRYKAHRPKGSVGREEKL